MTKHIVNLINWFWLLIYSYFYILCWNEYFQIWLGYVLYGFVNKIRNKWARLSCKFAYQLRLITLLKDQISLHNQSEDYLSFVQNFPERLMHSLNNRIGALIFLIGMKNNCIYIFWSTRSKYLLKYLEFSIFF